MQKENDAVRCDDTIDTARHYFRLALELIGKHKLPADPINYYIWYEYASGKNGALNAAIDAHLESKRAITPEVSRQLYSRHIAGDGEALADLVRQELKGLFAEIMGAIRTTDQQFSESENKLKSIDTSLFPGLTDADLKMIVDKLKTEIKGLESTSGDFKEQLQQATRELDQLKTKVAQYRDEALKDPLTQIANRRGFDKALQEMIDQAQRAATPLGLIIADIDHFKTINDTHGHLVGDNVIRMVAATIKNAIKGRDLVARIGGEEFAILLPETPSDGAMKLAEDMRLTFERLDLKKRNTGEGIGKITLSFGVSDYKSGEVAVNFVQRADGALYRSKNSGRNKVSGPRR